MAGALALLAFPTFGQTCGKDDAPCEVPLGTYHAAIPEDGATQMPAILFLHGAGGTGRGTLGISGTVRAILDRGYAVLAPDGLQWRPGRNGGSWSFLPEEQRERRRDEAAFFAEIVADAAERFGVDPNSVLLAGFSAGAFMVNYLACETPDAFPAYAPVSGGFWRPHPENCAGPVRLLHTHGFRDGTVPLEGRPLGSGQYLQGDIFEGLGLWRRTNDCVASDPDGYRTSGQFERRYWDCAPGSALEFALFPGGHGVPAGWVEMTLDWFEDDASPTENVTD